MNEELILAALEKDLKTPEPDFDRLMEKYQLDEYALAKYIKQIKKEQKNPLESFNSFKIIVQSPLKSTILVNDPMKQKLIANIIKEMERGTKTRKEIALNVGISRPTLNKYLKKIYTS